jgi:hypothetical protein
MPIAATGQFAYESCKNQPTVSIPPFFLELERWKMFRHGILSRHGMSLVGKQRDRYTNPIKNSCLIEHRMSMRCRPDCRSRHLHRIDIRCSKNFNARVVSGTGITWSMYCGFQVLIYTIFITQTKHDAEFDDMGTICVKHRKTHKTILNSQATDRFFAFLWLDTISFRSQHNFFITHISLP